MPIASGDGKFPSTSFNSPQDYFQNGAETKCLTPAAASWLVCGQPVTVHKWSVEHSGVELSRAKVSRPGHRSRQSLCSCLYLMSPHLTEQSLPIHWCSGSSRLVLLNARWPRPEVPVGFIYLSCGLPRLEKSTRLPNRDADQCPSSLQGGSILRVCA